jgi:hypothetical protein
MESHPRNIREQINMAFTEWQDEGKASKEEIIRALKEIHRNDLAHKLSSQS